MEKYQYTPSQVARITKRTSQCITYNIRKGNIKAHKIMDRWLIDEEEVRRIMNDKPIPKPNEMKK